MSVVRGVARVTRGVRGRGVRHPRVHCGSNEPHSDGRPHGRHGSARRGERDPHGEAKVRDNGAAPPEQLVVHEQRSRRREPHPRGCAERHVRKHARGDNDAPVAAQHSHPQRHSGCEQEGAEDAIGCRRQQACRR